MSSNELITRAMPTYEDLELDAREPNTSADLVRRVRLFHGWSQVAFAAVFNVSPRTIKRWEQRGTYFPDPALDAVNHAARIWRELHVRFEAAAQYRLTEEGVVEILSEGQPGRLDPVTLATRGALAALDRKRS